MSFIGGGSDMPAFYREEVGAVLSTSINKYVYITINKKFDNAIRVNYSTTEEVTTTGSIKHPLVRESLELLNVGHSIEIGSTADIPSKGSGLGSSSSFTVGLLHALHEYQGKTIDKDLLAELACEVEIKRCNEVIGKQDQYAAAFGGLNYIRFLPDDTVIVEELRIPSLVEDALRRSIIVFYTGRTRSASSVLVEQANNALRTNEKRHLRRMVELASLMKAELESSSIANIGEMLNENWSLKKQLSSSVSNEYIDSLYDVGIANGATGGKLLGAGNGGFLMLFADHACHDSIRKNLNYLREVKLDFEKHGSQIVFTDQKKMS
jgi:D-glycero-alpha-D-manno-heptose-7-phosphate kinase